MNPCIATYLSFCRRFEMPSHWQCFEPDDRSCSGPADPVAAIARLSDRHSKADLLASGITSLDAQRQLTMHPMLAEPNVVFVVLKNSMNGELTNLMTDAGCVLNATAPVFEVLADKITYYVLAGNNRNVFVTDTIVDTILLRSFGLAAAPIAGLGRLNQDGIKLLCDYYGVKQSLSDREMEEEDLRAENEDEEGQSGSETANLGAGQDSHDPTAGSVSSSLPQMPRYLIPGTGYVGKDSDEFVRLVLVRWSPSRLSNTESPKIKQAIDDLVALKRFRRLDIQEIGQWSPKDEELAAINFALERGEPEWVKGAFLDSAYSGICSLGEKDKATKAAGTPPKDLPGAVAHLQETLIGGADEKSRQRRKEALLNYHRVVERCVTLPMLRQAEAMTDPLDRSLQVQFAQLNTLFLEKAPTVHERIHQQMGQQREESAKNEGEKSVSELLAISAQMVALAKELMKCKPRTKTLTHGASGMQLVHSRRFADSDLAMKN
jgi:hypothetical protein